MALIEIAEHALVEEEVCHLLATDHPMVERFRFVRQGGQPGKNLRFALVIEPRPGVRYCEVRDSRGARKEPQWKTLTGQERIGQGNRSLWVSQQGEVMAENLTFFPNQQFNDLGIGSALYVSMERLYRRLGVRRISLLAVDVGVYVWARQGFAFETPGAAEELVPTLERFLFGHGAPLSAVDEGSLKESWDLANYDLPDSQTLDGYRAGKAFMLGCAPPWHGVKILGDPRHDEVAEASRRETFSRLPGKIEGAGADLMVR